MSGNNLKKPFFNRDKNNIKDSSSDKKAEDNFGDNNTFSKQNVLFNVGTNIRKARKMHKMSINDLATAANMSSKYLQGVEVGKRNISVTNLSKIASVLNIPTSHLFNIYDSNKSDKILEISNMLKSCNINQLDSIEKLLVGIDNVSDEPK